MREPALQRLFSQRGAVKRVADGLGISMAAVSAWRRVPPARVAQVAAILGVTEGELEGRDMRGTGVAKRRQTFREDATALGLDPDAIAEAALREAVRAEKARRWQEENREAIEAQNAWVEKHGVPLARYRMF
jgi:antitoxin CcdA